MTALLLLAVARAGSPILPAEVQESTLPLPKGRIVISPTRTSYVGVSDRVSVGASLFWPEISARVSAIDHDTWALNVQPSLISSKGEGYEMGQQRLLVGGFFQLGEEEWIDASLGVERTRLDSTLEATNPSLALLPEAGVRAPIYAALNLLPGEPDQLWSFSFASDLAGLGAGETVSTFMVHHTTAQKRIRFGWGAGLNVGDVSTPLTDWINENTEINLQERRVGLALDVRLYWQLKGWSE